MELFGTSAYAQVLMPMARLESIQYHAIPGTLPWGQSLELKLIQINLDSTFSKRFVQY
jgi:hypothetical protein